MIISAAQSILSKQAAGSINGFQSTLCSQKKGLFNTIPRGNFIQILFVGKNHWMATSNIVCGTSNYLTDTVRIYDSGRPNKISMAIKNQICSFVTPMVDRFSFDIVDVEGQVNSYDCGVYAIAYATHIVHGLDPVNYKWNAKKMRSHLIQCLINGHLDPFPVHGPRKIKFMKTIYSSSEDIYCLCRMPNNPKEQMIMCDLCSSWYHLKCISVDQETTIEKKKKWFCYKCQDLVKDLHCI